MARLKFIGFPPAPNDGDLWCLACCALAKGKVLAPLKEQIEAKLADDREAELTIDVKTASVAGALNVAVTWGPVSVLGGTAGPLCWDHLPAVDGDAPMAAPPGNGAAGLYRGRGLMN